MYLCCIILSLPFIVVADIQKNIKDAFEFSESDMDVPFQEFHEEDAKKKNELLKSFAQTAKQKGLMAVVKMAIEIETKKKYNPSLVQSALSVFLTHDKEAKRLGVAVPPLALQGKFKRLLRPFANPVSLDTLHGPELLSYFREDYDLNDHHNHWHDVYPGSGIDNGEEGNKRTIQRQGELFLYMHSQMLARYNAELLAWNLDGVHAFNYDDVLISGYLPPPGLQHNFSSRPAFRGWFENHNPDITEKYPLPKSEMIKYRNNIFKAIEDGFFLTTGGGSGKYILTEANAMNTVGVVIEAENSELQEVEKGVFTDRSVYGSLHNSGHNKFAEIGYTKDKPKYGVMGDVETAVRDHVFWLWHRHVDDFRQIIVRKYTQNLLAYKPDAEILSLEIVPQNASETPVGGLATYLCPPNLKRNEVHAKLRHEPYQWNIIVKSTLHTAPTRRGPQVFTVRLFITMKNLIQDQRAWIEMDKFTYSLEEKQHVIVRKDTESAVARKVKVLLSDSRCSCGWPQNLMLPIGKPEGVPYVAFAMLTTGELGSVSVIN